VIGFRTLRDEPSRAALHRPALTDELRSRDLGDDLLLVEECVPSGLASACDSYTTAGLSTKIVHIA
jgi:hypothetical protein